MHGMTPAPAIAISGPAAPRANRWRRAAACLVSGVAHLAALTAFAMRQPPLEALPSLAGDNLLSVQVVFASEPPGQPPVEARELEAKVVVMPAGAEMADRRYLRSTHELPPWPTPAQAPPPERTPGPVSLASPASADDHAPQSPPSALPRVIASAETSAASESSAAPQTAGTDQTSLPELLDNPPPQYPQEALRKRWQGTVELRLRISAQGTVAELTVARSSGAAVLDAAAVSAVKHWRFKPALQRGQPAEATIRLPVVFELR